MLYLKYVFPWPYLWWDSSELPKSFIATPLPSLTVMFFLGGFMCILLGIQAEVIMRTYYESQAKTTYLLGDVRQETTIGLSEGAGDGYGQERMLPAAKEV
jgi:hypothetical protein